MTPKSRSAPGIFLASALVGLFFMFLASASPAADTAGPAVDREASERYFLSAYGHFLENRLWNTLDDLDESLGQNVYFVDVYYMRSLALRRLGRFPEAIEAMSYYLEVRRDDYRGRIILDSMKSEWEMISGMLSPSGPAYETGFSSRTVNSFFALPPYSPLALKGMSGIGKILCAGENIWVCDTLGGSVWVFGLNERYTLRADIQRPSALIPVSSSEALLFLEDGSVYRLGIDPASKETSLSEAGTIEADIADAAFIDSSLFAVADRRGGAVRFVGADGFGQAAEWRPPGKEADGPFEPVAVSSYGPLLAVADRGGGRIFVLDSYTMSVLGSFGINTPRDLEWGRQGELYILNESGVLYSCFPARDASADVRVTAEGMKDAWSISWMDEGPVISSVSGRTWWIGTAGPGRSETFGAITLHDPWITKNDDGTEMLILRGAASSVFHGFVRDRAPVTQVVWRGEVRPSAVTGIKTVQEGLPRFYSPNAGPTPDGQGIIQADSIQDVMNDIAEVSRSGAPLPGVIVLDTRISVPEGQETIFLGFLLQQGIRLDLWAARRPASLAMSRVSRITLGRTGWSADAPRVQGNARTEWILSVPLPPDVDTFGYPSDTTLSFMSDIDVIRFADWLPIWPSLIKKD